MHARKAPHSRLILAFAIVYLVWGSTYLAIRYAIHTIPPFLMAGTRFLIAGAILYGWEYFRGTPRPTRLHWRNTTILGGLLLLCGNGSVVWAEQSVPSGITALLVATVPLWLVMLQWIGPARKRPHWGVILGVLVGMTGMVVLIGPDSLRGQGDIPLSGFLVLLFGSFMWAAGSLYGGTAKLPSTIFATSMEMLTGGIFLLIMAGITGEFRSFDMNAVSVMSILGTLYLIVFGSIVAYTAYTWLLTAASPAAVGTYAYVNPVVAVFLGWAIAGEPVSLRTILGATIIIGAVVVVAIVTSSRPSR